MRDGEPEATGGGARGAGLHRHLAAVLLLVGLWYPAAAAQPAADAERAVAAVEAAYEALDYAQAEALARQALARPAAFTPRQLVRLHTTLALLLFTRNDALAAGEQFRAALSLDPNLTLDPVLVSPVTLAFFDDTKAAFLRERTGADRPGPTVHYVVVRDSRPDAALRSVVLPGWGQRHRGATARGWVLTGTWAALLGGGVAAHLERGRQRDAYLGETDPDLVEARYRTYNAWHKTRGALLAGAGAVWAVAVIDALASGAPEAPARLAVGPGGAGLRLRVGL